MKRYKNTWKKYFLNNLGLSFSAREKVLNRFKSRLFPLKNLNKTPTREPTPEPATEPEVATEPTKATKAKPKRKISSLKLLKNFKMKLKKKLLKKYTTI